MNLDMWHIEHTNDLSDEAVLPSLAMKLFHGWFLDIMNHPTYLVVFVFESGYQTDSEKSFFW